MRTTAATTFSHSPPAPSPSQSKTLSLEEFEDVKAFLDSSDRPFNIVTVPLSRKRKRGPPLQLQHDMFEDRLSIQYQVKPKDKWESLRRYKRFTVGSETIGSGQCILVKYDEKDDARIDLKAQWKALVLEVRALDGVHVYVRVAWLYRPEDLPGGRKDYHGHLELIPSNQMDIIDAMAVNGSVEVVHWNEKDDSSAMMDNDQFFWRQTYDWAGSKTFSTLRKICIDKTPHNPDQIILNCPNATCRKWVHATCVANAALHRSMIEETKSPKTTPSKGTPSVTERPHARNATVSLGHPKTRSSLFVDLFISGEPSESSDVEPAERSEIVTTFANGEQKREPACCLFCGTEIDS